MLEWLQPSIDLAIDMSLAALTSISSLNILVMMTQGNGESGMREFYKSVQIYGKLLRRFFALTPPKVMLF